VADLELHLSRFRIDDDVVAVQHLTIENLQRERVLDQLLDCTLQRTRAEVGIEAFGEQ